MPGTLVDISSNLSWNTHVNRITSNANRFLGFIKTQHQNKVPPNPRSSIPVLGPTPAGVEYASSAWDHNTKENKGKLEIVQRRAARWNLNDYASTTSVTSLMAQLGWQTLIFVDSKSFIAFYMYV